MITNYVGYFCNYFETIAFVFQFIPPTLYSIFIFVYKMQDINKPDFLCMQAQKMTIITIPIMKIATVKQDND